MQEPGKTGILAAMVLPFDAAGNKLAETIWDEEIKR
jgi:hypothetical protein